MILFFQCCRPLHPASAAPEQVSADCRFTPASLRPLTHFRVIPGHPVARQRRVLCSTVKLESLADRQNEAFTEICLRTEESVASTIFFAVMALSHLP